MGFRGVYTALMQISMKAEFLTMSDDARGDRVEQVANELNVGLKSCRALIDDYRAKISGARTADNNNEPAQSNLSRSG